MRVEHGVHALLQRFGRGLGREAEVEVDHRAARNHVARAGARVEVADLPAGGLEVGVALCVPATGGVDRHQFGQCGRHRVHRVLRQVRVRDVALHAVHRELAAHGAAAAVLDHVAAARDRGGLADDAVVDGFTACGQRVADDHGAVDARAFLVAGQQQGQRERRVGLALQELFDGGHEGRDRGLHVAGAAAVELAVAVRGRERVAAPLVERAGGHHVGVAGKHQRLRGLAIRGPAHGPEVGDPEIGRAALDGFQREAQRGEAFAQDLLATRVVGGDGRARDQLFGELERTGHRGSGD
ncbi:hypothetical protein FQZ97_864840 [compost metagenome]